MLDVLMAAPVLVKVLGSLAIILIMTRFCKHLLASIAIGTVALGFWCGHSVPEMLSTAWGRFWSVDNFCLMVIIFQVIWLSSQMAATGVMRELVDSVRAMVSPRTSMAVLPAVIGLLPMPGGALFSAPLVDSCDVDGQVLPALKAKTNYFFRHVWEFWWPLYPGVILAMDITGLEPWHFMLMGIPLSVCAVLAGRQFLLRKIELDPLQYEGEARPKPQESFLSLVAPIIVVIACYTVYKLGYGLFRTQVASAPALNKYVPMIFGLFCAILVLAHRRPLELKQWKGILLSKRTFTLAVIVAVVRIYGAFIEAPLPSGVPLVSAMRTEMDNWGIPVLAIMMLIPFISGLTTGLAVGYVGASFPIVINLLGQDPTMGTLLATTVLAYGFGYAGMLLSPVHVCLVVTSEHFKTPIAGNIAGLIKPGAVIMAAALAMYFVLGWLIA